MHMPTFGPNPNATPVIPDIVNDIKVLSTGAKRESKTDKTRYDLMPALGLRRVAETLAEGAENYGVGNWEKGMPVDQFLNHAIAHIYDYLKGDRSEDHLGHAACNLLMAIDSEERWPLLNEELMHLCELRRGDKSGV